MYQFPNPEVGLHPKDWEVEEEEEGVHHPKDWEVGEEEGLHLG